MTKRILLSLMVVAALAVGVIGMSAFEAHVINVTAHIENALTVVTTPIDFGSVFPQESLVSQSFTVDLSSSFLNNQTRVGQVNYKIETKPKCKNAGGEDVLCVYNSVSQKCECPAETATMEDLCKFLSVTTEENGDISRSSYFNSQNSTCSESNPAIATGSLNKQTPDISDAWLVDFKVPPIAGYIGQEWPVNCADYIVRENGQSYGCDLWVEVTGISADGGIEPECIPTEEVCDGINNDCDSETDEGCQCLNGASQSCGQTNEGECSLGTRTCVDGIFGACVGNIDPVTEICADGLDNDCDGSIDCADADCSQNPVCHPGVMAGDVVINEVAWMGTTFSTSDEWIELKNTTNNNIDLTGWTLNATDGTPAISLSGSIQANGYYLLERTDDTSVPGVTADKIYSGDLGNDGEVLNLRDSSDTIIDNVNASSDWPAGESTTTTKKPMIKCGNNWNTSPTNTGTPRAQNSCPQTITFNNLNADPQYGYTHNYGLANASFTYSTPTSGNLSGTITATGLKPYATYQLKFEATPTCLDPVNGNDAINEIIGYHGRWWNITDNASLNSTPTNNDANYLANSVYHGGTKCIRGYLVWGYITANASGNVNQSVTVNNSYHVLWSGGGVCNTNVNSFLSALDPAHPGIMFSPSDKVDGEIERSTCNGLTLPTNNYGLKMFLTEESFHQGPWTSVMDANINFAIN